MPIQKIEGLKGLRSLWDLSETERNNFLSEYSDKLQPYSNSAIKYNKAASILYDNRRFIDRFGEEEFNKLSYDERNAKYRESVANDAIQIYKGDSWFPQISNMTTEGKIGLLESGFETDAEWSSKVEEMRGMAQEVGQDKTANFLRDLAMAGNVATTTEVGMTTKEDELQDAVDAYEEGSKKSRQEKFEALLQQDNLRKVEQSMPISSSYLESWQTAINNGTLQVEDVDAEFDKFIAENSRYYKAFKDTDVFEHFTSSDKMKFLADFMGVAHKFGMESALSAIDTKMQNYVSDNQSAWDWAGNTTKNILLKGTANLANKVMGVEALLSVGDQEGLSNFLQGLDEEGNELPWYNNPLYWQGVDQFNTFDSNEIKRARENGGISPYQNITRAGEEMNFLSWKTLNDAAGQLGYVWSEMLASRLMGGMGKGMGRVAPVLKTSKLAKGLGTILDIGQSVVGMAEAEGLSSFQETLRQANEVIDSQIDREVEDQVRAFAETEDFTSLVKSKEEALITASKEQSVKYTSEGLRSKATEMALQELSSRFRAEAESRHAEDREQAERASLSAYMTTSTIFAVKEAATNSMFQRFLYNKGTRQALGDNGPKIDIVNNADGTVSASISKWNKYAKPVLSNSATEFLEEVSDNAVNNFGQGFGLNEYLSYHNKKYNPEAYVAATDGIIGNIISGFDKAGESLTSKDAYYEGFIGAVSGVGGAPVKIYQGWQKGRSLGREVEAINKVLRENGSALQDIASTLSTLHESDVAVSNGDMLSAIDAKQRQAFDLVHALTELGNSEVGSQSNTYINSMQTIEALAKGTLEETKMRELITQFLGQPSNRTIASQPGAEEQAAKLLQENAQSILDTQASINEVYTTLDNIADRGTLAPEVKTELAYLKVMGKNWQSRLNSIEEALGGGKGTFSAEAEYGSKKAYERKRRALGESISSMKSKLRGVQESIKEDYYEDQAEKRALKLREKALKSAIKKAELEYKSLKDHSNLFEDSEFSRTLSKEEILALPADQRAWILNPANLGDYSQEQQLIIEELRNDLITKDPALIQQVQDAAVLSGRVSDVNTAFSRMINNPIEAIQYLEELKKQRTQRLYSIYQQRARERVEDLFQGVSDDEAKSTARDLPYTDVENYIADHPEREEMLRGVSEVSRFREDAELISRKLLRDADNNTRSTVIQSILNITSNSNSEEEAIDAIEDVIDSDAVDNQTKVILDSMLNELQELNYQRNSTKVSNREAKRERQAAKERAAEEAIKRQEEALKIAEEEAKTKVEVPKDGSNLVPETMEDVGISPDGSNIQETVEVDETKVGSEEQLVGAEDVDLIDRVESPTPAEQSKDNPEIKEVQTIPPTPEEPTSVNSVILVGNAMYRYEGAPLKDDGYQVKRAGSQEGDPMNKFFGWMDNAGINYQEIIDNELHSILAVNPKIQFLLVNPQDNATNDVDMNDHVLEVVEYTPQVAKVHKESNGGVISANGKRWLVVGTLGFGRYSGEQRKVYGDLKYELKKRRFQYTKANPDERFYVDPFYSTEVAKLDAGWVTRRLVGDTEVKIRSIRELLNDEARNPRGLALEDLKWGIQSDSAFQAVGVSSRNKIHPPKDTLGNSGGAFLLVESANGEYIPIALKPVMYGELRDSKLKTVIDNLLVELTSPNHTERHTAISKLVQLLYLKENNILIGTKDKNTLSITKGDVVIKTFDLNDPAFNRMEFLESVTALNPRVNVTLTALSSPATLEMLDEAGVLLTDAAKLGTSNASFSVYNVGPDGKPIINAPIENTAPGASDLRKVESSVLVLGQVYRKRKDGWVDAVDRVITDPRMIEQIRYNNIIQSSNLAPVATKDNQEYFIISQDMSNPVAVKRAIGTNTVTVASREQALALIEQMAKKAAEKKAAEALSKATLDESSLEDVSLGEEVMTQEDIYGQMFGEFVVEGDVTLDENIPEEITPVVVEDINTTGTKSLAELQTGKELSTLGDILGNSEYGNRLDEILDRKAMSEEWVDIPDDISLLGSYLRKKGIATSGITDVDSWLNMIDECK